MDKDHLAAAPEQRGELPEPAAWEGAEGWEALAWHLCADENGEDACNELVWEGGPIPEPWGDRWLKYEGEAKRMIELVGKYAGADQLRTAIAAEREQQQNNAGTMSDTPKQPDAPEPTAEMIAAYLNANRAYWQRIDAEPGKIGKWRNGTAEEATAYGLRAALAAQAEKHAAQLQTDANKALRHIEEQEAQNQALRAQVDAAVPAMRDYARRNPRWVSWDNGEVEGEMQDPNGVNAWLEQIDAAIAARGEAK